MWQKERDKYIERKRNRELAKGDREKGRIRKRFTQTHEQKEKERNVRSQLPKAITAKVGM